MKVFASTNVYGLAKRLGMKGALSEFERQILAPDPSSLPCVRTLFRVREMADVALLVDCGLAAIGKSRSRSFHAALESDAQAWITVDDDIEATTETMAGLLELLDDDIVARVVTVPYVLRNPSEERLSVQLPTVRIERLISGYRLCELPRQAFSGFGLVGMNRRALERIGAAMAASVGYYVDDDNVRKLAAFHELIESERWYGEDASFFRRVPSDVDVCALLSGVVSHDGTALDLGKL